MLILSNIGIITPERGAMMTILFTDILGTLISESEMFSVYDKKYSKEFELSKRNLEAFFSAGNILVLVTATDHTDVNAVFADLYKNCFAQYQRQIYNYVFDNHFTAEQPSKIENNGISYTLVPSKRAAVDLFFSEKPILRSMATRLLALGDSNMDIGMLLKVLDLGGKSAIICNHLYQDATLTSAEIIDKIVEAELFAERQEACRKYRSEHQNLQPLSVIEAFSRRRNARIEELHQRLRAQEINLDTLRRQWQTLLALQGFDRYRYYHPKLAGDDLPSYSEEPFYAAQRLEEFVLYPTFLDFYNKVLTFSGSEEQFIPQP